MSDDQFDEFLDSTLASFPLKNGGVFYLCAPAGHTETQFRNAIARNHDYSLRQCIVWVKDRFVYGRQDYHWRHESILYGWKHGAAHYFVKDRIYDTVWEIARPSISKNHPTMKPIELYERGISNSSRLDEVIMDGFVGSGTAIAACERLNRRCRAIEIEPKYCAVTIQRWHDLTNRQPQLL